MGVKEELAAKWQAEIDVLEERATFWETGGLRAHFNGVDVTHEQAPMLRRHADALREALDILRID